ncbi:MAG: tetratricopeptide repeat protein [Saprospiraceae bacterium]|nr:tetratricopeptide repeat protein [Saprospiraceae bacterium]
MTKLQIGTILMAIALFLGLYFGCDTNPPEQAAIEKSRALTVESTDINALLLEAKSGMGPQEESEILALETEMEAAADDSSSARVLKELSGKWYEFGQPAIAGFYAEEVAGLENSGAAWSIAGTTYALCLQTKPPDKIRDFCSSRAVKAFENAISLDPEEVSNRVNLALVYTEAPPPGNPMKGILMLRDLNEQYPENVSVLVNLSRLALQTGQYDRAVERLQQALELDAGNRQAACLLAQAYQGLGRQSEAEEWASRCNSPE